MTCWSEVPIKDVAYFQEGPGLRNWQWADSGVKVINGRNVLLDGRIDLSNTDKFVSLDEFQHKYKHFGIQPNDILVTSSGTLGKVGRVKSEHLPLMMNTSVIRFRSSNNAILNEDYLFCYLRSPHFQKQIIGYAIGAAQANFGPSHIKLMSMPLPPLLVQRRIAGVLAAYDNLIENGQRRIRILEAMARAFYEEWFVKLRFPGHENNRMVPSALGEIPEGWVVTELISVCDGKTGVQTGPFGSQLHESDYSNTGVPVVMPKDLIGFRVRTDSIARIPEATACQLERHRMNVGDIVYGRRGDIGRRAFITQAQNGWLCGTGCLRIRPNPNAVHGWYLFNHLGEDEVVGMIAGRAHGVTMPNLNTGVLASLPVKIPPRELQDQFAHLSAPLTDAAETLTAANKNLLQTRNLILPRLLSGQISLAPINR